MRGHTTGLQEHSDGPVGGLRPYLIFGVLASTMVLVAMQFSTSAVALPAIIDDLNPPLRWAGWVFTTFTLAQIVTLPLAGRLAERFGARQMFVGGVVGFAAGSLICGAAPEITILIAGRAVQGLSGGLIQPSIFGLVSEQFPERRARWIGLLSSLIPIAAILGPNIGGLIVDEWGWRWTFAFNLPVALLLLAAAVPLLPSSAQRSDVTIRYSSAALLGLATTLLIYGLTELGRSSGGPSPPLLALPFIASAVLLAIWIRRETRSADPLVDLDLLRRREFAFANALAFCFGVCFLGMFSFVPLYIQDGYGISASATGVLLTPRAVAMVLTSMLAAMLITRTGYRKPIMISLWGMAAAVIVLAQGVREPVIAGFMLSNFTWLLLVNCALGLAFGVGSPSQQNIILDLAPDRVPAVVGLRGMFSSLGGTVGVALISAVIARASTVESGLEFSFIAVAGVFMAASLLVLGIPDMRRG